jgi:hypothetical protein
MSTKKLSFFNKIANKITDGIKGFFSKNDKIVLVSHKEINPDTPYFDKVKEEYKKVSGLKIELNATVINVYKNNNLSNDEKLVSLQKLDQAISKELASLVDTGLKESLQAAKDLISQVTGDIEKDRNSISPELKNELNNVNLKLRDTMNKHSKQFLSAEEADMITSVHKKVDLYTSSFLKQSSESEFKRVIDDCTMELKKAKEESNIKGQKNAKFIESQMDVVITTTTGMMKNILYDDYKRNSVSASNVKPEKTPNQEQSQSSTIAK